jgi:hypothetical protein
VRFRYKNLLENEFQIGLAESSHFFPHLGTTVDDLARAKAGCQTRLVGFTTLVMLELFVLLAGYQE